MIDAVAYLDLTQQTDGMLRMRSRLFEHEVYLREKAFMGHERFLLTVVILESER
jgi:hypothetical protein